LAHATSHHSDRGPTKIGKRLVLQASRIALHSRGQHTSSVYGQNCDLLHSTQWSVSTIYALGKGGEELNPLFGKHPSGLRVFLQGTAIIGTEIGVSWLLHSYKPIAGTIAGAVMLLQSVIHFVLGYKNFHIK